jgi:hypothetical protein
MKKGLLFFLLLFTFSFVLGSSAREVIRLPQIADASTTDTVIVVGQPVAAVGGPSCAYAKCVAVSSNADFTSYPMLVDGGTIDDATERAAYFSDDTNYTTLALAQEGENAVTLSGILQIEILGDDWNASPDTSPVEWDRWTCDYTGGDYIIVKTVGAARPDYAEGDNWDTTAYVLQSTQSAAPAAMEFDNDQATYTGFSIILDGLQIEQITNDFPIVKVVGGSENDTIIIQNSYLKQGAGAAGAAADGIELDEADATVLYYVINTIIEGGGDSSEGIVASKLMGGLHVVNSIITGFSEGIDASNSQDGNIEFINSAVFNNGNDFVETTYTTVTYTACDDIDCDSGTGNIGWDDSATDWDNNFADYTTNDLRIVDTGADIYHSGQSQSGDARIPADDINGTTRPSGASAVSMGPWENL